MQTNLLDIQQGRIKHFLYKSKLRSALYGGSVDDTFFSPAGPMGEWISTIGMPKYGTAHEMRQIDRIQREMNNHASQLISLYKRGRIQEAKDGMSKIESFSEQILELFDSLEKAG